MRRRRRGTALVAALFTIALLTTVTATVSVQARSSAGFAANQRALVVARLMAESGILAAQARLSAELREGLARGEADSAGLDAVWDAVARREAGRDPGAWVADTLDDGAFEAAVVNVSARLDVNAADGTSLDALFRQVAPPGAAARVTAQRPFLSLDALQETLGRDATWLSPLADQLTVDGDGRIDRRHASPAVLAAATGALVDRPTRVLLVARGWQVGHPLSREIQAVYEVAGPTLTLVRWRERDR